MRDFEAAIFDLDGTVIDSMYVWQKVDVDFLTKRGIPVTKEYTETVRGMFFETAAEYTRSTYGLNESVEEIVKTWLEMARYEYANNVRLKPFTKEYLDYLKERSVKLGMATSSNPALLEPVLWWLQKRVTMLQSSCLLENFAAYTESATQQSVLSETRTA